MIIIIVCVCHNPIDRESHFSYRNIVHLNCGKMKLTRYVRSQRALFLLLLLLWWIFLYFLSFFRETMENRLAC